MRRGPTKGQLVGWFLTALLAIPVTLAGLWLFVEAFLVSLPVGLLLAAALLAALGAGTVPVVLLVVIALLTAGALGARRFAELERERQQAERARADTESHLRQILETAPDAFVAIDADGVIIDWNQSAEALLGWPRAKAIGRPLAATILPEQQRDAFVEGLKVAAVSGDGPVIGRKLELVAVHRDGHQVPIALTISPTPVAGGYSFHAFLHAAGDAHWAQEEVERSRTLLADLLDSAPDAVVIADERGQITLVNEQTERLFGYDRTELFGAPVETLLPQRFHERHVGNRARYLEAPGTRPMGVGLDLAGRRKDGTEFPVDISLSAITTDKGRLVTAFVRDITERKQTQDQLAAAHEKALEASRLKSEFVANMSHEIRTPLNGVMGMSGLLLDTDLTEEQREYAEAVRTSGDALMTVVEDILDFSKIEAGKLDLVSEAFGLRDLVEDACAMVATDANGRGLELISSIDGSVPDAVWGDGARVRQVLVNLLSNAVKFTSAGEVLASVTGRMGAEGRLALRVEVSDTGIGIPKESLTGIFDSFSQGDSSTTRSYGGTGLGLAISKRLVELMGGEIGVVSQVGSGSTFWFTLELGVARAAPRFEPMAFDGVRALVVDDNATSRRILEQRLTSWGMDCTVAPGATQAMVALRNAARAGEAYRLVLVDARMPGFDGIELAMAIRREPGVDHPRILMLTSSGSDRHRAGRAGVRAFLPKPVREARLHEEIARLLASRALPPPSVEPVVSSEVAPVEPVSPRVVLVVEDNPVNQLVASRLLEKRGLSVDLAANGREAVDKHREVGYGLIFMDCQMPELDGYQATAEIRAWEGSQRHTRIIAMTASTMKGDRERCLAAGMDDYLGKPVDQTSLDQVLANSLPPENGHSSEADRPLVPEDLDDLPILDPSLLADIADRDAALRERLGAMFTEQSAAALDELAEQLEAGDLEAARRTAHTLKGSASVIGAKRLAEISARLCLAAEEGLAEDAAALLADLAAAQPLTIHALAT